MKQQISVMENFSIFVCALFMLACGCHASSAYNESCTVENASSGTIRDRINAQIEERCWIIEVPEDGSVVFKLKISFESSNHNGLEIIRMENGETKTITRDSVTLDKYVYSSSVKIVHFARNAQNYWWSEFVFDYKIVSGITAVEGVEDSLSKATAWMEKQRTVFWGWKENTPRAVVAMYLANAIRFTGDGQKEELIAKETDIRSSIALLKKSITLNELSMIVNALLVTCHNPHHFYGNNLVKRLKAEVEANNNFTHPIVYLALCNAGETWPSKTVEELNRVLSDNSNYQFVKEIQAMAVMALSCSIKRGVNITDVSNTSSLYENAIQRFIASQLEDGSFGNAHSTALITQALIASGQERAKDWNLRGTIKYLMKALDSSSLDILTAYLTLPVLNAKSLVDISSVDCSESLRKHGDDTMQEIHDSLGFHIRVKYSLYFGDNKDVIHTISLKVPENSTAYEVMERAAIQDPKFKFEGKRIFGKVYVYKIANLTNDSENGKFWLQYVWTSRLTMEPVTKGPDELIMKDGQHLIMWYKTMHI